MNDEGDHRRQDSDSEDDNSSGESSAGVRTLMQSPFCESRRGSLTKELRRYVQYDWDFFANYSAAVLIFLVAAAVFFYWGTAVLPPKDENQMIELTTALLNTLANSSTTSAEKLLSIRDEARNDILKLWRFQMFTVFSAVNVSLAQFLDVLRTQSKNILDIFSSAQQMGWLMCDEIKQGLTRCRETFPNDTSVSVAEAAQLAIDIINISKVMPFFVQAHVDFGGKTCLKLHPSVEKAINSDETSRHLKKAWFCPKALLNGSIPSTVLNAVIQSTPPHDFADCTKMKLKFLNQLAVSLSAAAQREERSLVFAKVLRLFLENEWLEGSRELRTLAYIASWVSVAKEKCPQSALVAFVENRLDAASFQEPKLSGAVFSVLGKLAERRALGSCEEVFVNVFFKLTS